MLWCFVGQVLVLCGVVWCFVGHVMVLCGVLWCGVLVSSVVLLRVMMCCGLLWYGCSLWCFLCGVV